MNDVPWGPIATGFGAVLLFLGTWLGIRATRADRRIDNAQKSYDQLQEDLKDARGEITAMRAELANVKKAHHDEIADVKAELSTARSKITELERVQRFKDEYIWKLRQHILNGNPPPPPDWPEEAGYR